MRGTKCNVVIKQGAEENFQPTLYVEALSNEGLDAFEASLTKAVNQDLAAKYPGINLSKLSDKLWVVNIPASFKVGHEAHFTQVAQKYLRFLVDGKMPEWEVPNMIVKYYTTTEALKKARQ